MIRNNFAVIQGWMVEELKLKGGELLIYAVIYGFSQTENQMYTGTLSYLGAWTNMSKSGVLKCLKNLIEKGLLEKQSEYVNGVKFCSYKALKTPENDRKYEKVTVSIQSEPVVDKVHHSSTQSEPVVDKVHHSSTQSEPVVDKVHHPYTKETTDVQSIFDPSNSFSFREKTGILSKENPRIEMYTTGTQSAPNNINIDRWIDRKIDTSIHPSEKYNYNQGDIMPLGQESNLTAASLQRETYREILKKNVEYDSLIGVFDLTDVILNNWITMMIDTIMSNAESFKIADQDIPRSVLSSIFMKIQKEHLVHAILTYRRSTAEIKHPQAYMRACLYSAYCTRAVQVDHADHGHYDIMSQSRN